MAGPGSAPYAITSKPFKRKAGGASAGWVGSSQKIYYSLQPRATEIPTETSYTSHNSRITEQNWFVCRISSFYHREFAELENSLSINEVVVKTKLILGV